jgi:hypothetical protein
MSWVELYQLASWSILGAIIGATVAYFDKADPRKISVSKGGVLGFILTFSIVFVIKLFID